MPTFYLPGNHDVECVFTKTRLFFVPFGLHFLSLGRHSPDVVKSLARARYLTHFGPTNHRFVVHNATLVFLDAPGIVDEYEVLINQLKKEDWKRYARKGGALSFL
ncbi:MAG TPA: hypothetical protein VGO47_12225, partial [Chlamydiales bacterium]|nr:hypothetical protein [Chlamydiales bacterium]